MKKVFIFVVKKFSLFCGTDIAIGIENSDIHILKTKKDAEDLRKKIFERYKELYVGAEESFHDGSIGNYWQLRMADGFRIVFDIIERKFE